jgi:hypothetical protein
MAHHHRTTFGGSKRGDNNRHHNDHNHHRSSHNLVPLHLFLGKDTAERLAKWKELRKRKKKENGSDAGAVVEGDDEEMRD